MRKQRGIYRGTDSKQRAILDAALACFTEMGFLNTTMGDIRRRSGASNGSIYHHFKSKEELAAAVYLQGILDYQTGLKAEFLNSMDARTGIRTLVRYHLEWVRNRPEYARFLFRMRHADFMELAEERIAAANREFFAPLQKYFRRQAAAGVLRPMPDKLYLAVALSPTHEFARRYLLAGKVPDLTRVMEELAESAWQGLRARGEQDFRGAGKLASARKKKGELKHGRT